MGKKKSESGIGWLGLSLISTVVTVLTAAAIVFFSLFPVFTEDKQVTKAEQTTDKGVEVQKTDREVYQQLGEFVSKMHDFYNETTGYGRIESLNWDQQAEQAENIIKTIEKELPGMKDEALHHDLKTIQNVAGKAAAEQKTGHVRELHRMFHDLDIALNHYNGYDKIWNVTETLEKTKKEE